MKLKDVEKESACRPLPVITDSDNLKVTVNRDSGTCADKRLRIVVSMLRESVEEHENTTLIWTRTEGMVADGLTKVAGSLAILIAFFASKKFVVPPPQRKRQAAKPTQVLMASKGATSWRRSTASSSLSTSGPRSAPWRSTASSSLSTSGSCSATPSSRSTAGGSRSATPSSRSAVSGSSSARIGVRIATIAAGINNVRATKTDNSLDENTGGTMDFIIICTLLGILIMMMGAIAYLMWQMREIRGAVTVRREPRPRPSSPVRTARPSRSRELVAEDDDDMFKPIEDEIMVENERVRTRTERGTRAVQAEVTQQEGIDFKKIERMLEVKGLKKIPVFVKVGDRTFRHYDNRGNQITKDEAMRMANGVAYYCDKDTPEAGRLRMRGVYCSYESARVAIGGQLAIADGASGPSRN